MADTCVPSVTVIDTTVEQLQTNVSLITMYCPPRGCLLTNMQYCRISVIVIGSTINQLKSNVSYYNFVA